MFISIFIHGFICIIICINKYTMFNRPKPKQGTPINSRKEVFKTEVEEMNDGKAKERTDVFDEKEWYRGEISRMLMEIDNTDYLSKTYHYVSSKHKRELERNGACG